VQFGGDWDMQGEEVVNVKMESDIASEDGRCGGVSGEEGLCSEEEDGDIKEEDIHIKEEVIDIQGEVSVEVPCNVLWSEC
jgi:hypothetical protein